MSLSVCKDCTARYAPDLRSCPQCGSAESVPNWVADAEAAADLWLTGDGEGFHGAEGLTVLKAAAEGAEAGNAGAPDGEPGDPPAALPVLPVPRAPEAGAVAT